MTLGSIASGIETFFIAFSFACYILFQKERLYIQVRKVIFAFISRQKADALLKICSLTYRTFANFLAGQCLEAIILGFMFVVTLSILKMPYALLIGILIAFTALIPIFGAFIGCAVGVFLIFMVSPKQAVLFIIIFLLLQQIEGNLIYPHVVGGSVGLPSIWVLAAVTIGGNLMGIVGMLIFIPTVSVFYTIFREYVYLRLKKQNIKRVTRTEVEEYDKRV
nr:AI-2E family transporter [Blautia obeum]